MKKAYAISIWYLILLGYMSGKQWILYELTARWAWLLCFLDYIFQSCSSYVFIFLVIFSKFCSWHTIVKNNPLGTIHSLGLIHDWFSWGLFGIVVSIRANARRTVRTVETWLECPDGDKAVTESLSHHAWTWKLDLVQQYNTFNHCQIQVT